MVVIYNILKKWCTNQSERWIHVFFKSHLILKWQQSKAIAGILMYSVSTNARRNPYLWIFWLTIILWCKQPSPPGASAGVDYGPDELSATKLDRLDLRLHLHHAANGPQQQQGHKRQPITCSHSGSDTFVLLPFLFSASSPTSKLEAGLWNVL